MLNDEIAVSTMSMPASAALMVVTVLIPVVACDCIAIGILQLSLGRATSSSATYGFSNPAMSLMQIEWQPMSSMRLPRSIHIASVCTGLTVYPLVLWAGLPAFP